MTIKKASELFAQDGRFFPSEPWGDDPNPAVFAPLPADEVEEEDYAALVAPEGRLEEWWVAVSRRRRGPQPAGAV
jgi:hypothetical protein